MKAAAPPGLTAPGALLMQTHEQARGLDAGGRTIPRRRLALSRRPTLESSSTSLRFRACFFAGLKSPSNRAHGRAGQWQLIQLLLPTIHVVSWATSENAILQDFLMEPAGIEPATSCLQRA
ncbi:MAG TPA: hypothetical protein VHX66_07280, partial [Solirubrobacteraceae bacterium]|nr:hypothetical protein [Solirubrobacteraceae bacterium]